MMKDLSSNDLTALITMKNPDSEIIAVMDGVAAVLGKPRGWDNTIKNVVGKDFMFSIGEVDYEKLSFDRVQAAREFKDKYNSSSLMRKDKSAGAFGTWIEGIVSVRAIIDDKMVDLQEM